METTGRAGPASATPGGPRVVGPVALAAALLLAAGCGGRTADGEDGPEEGAPRPGAGAEAAPAPWTDSAPGVALDSVLRRIEALVGGSRAEARGRQGSPGEERRREVPNRHTEDAVDTIVRLTWPELAATYHKSGANQREFLQSVEVTGGPTLRRVLPPPLREREGLRRALGPAERAEGGRWSYVCCPGRPGAPESLDVRLEGERVTRLRAGYFVD